MSNVRDTPVQLLGVLLGQRLLTDLGLGFVVPVTGRLPYCPVLLPSFRSEHATQQPATHQAQESVETSHMVLQNPADASTGRLCESRDILLGLQISQSAFIRSNCANRATTFNSTSMLSDTH